MIDTKQRILDTAERLIADRGYAATSLRHIIGEAGVNLAAVHYHFGSKEDLLDELILQKATGVNTERLALLDRFEAEAGGGPVPVEKVMSAFFEPMIEVGSRNPQFVRLMGRMYAEGLLAAVVAKHFQPTLARFLDVLRRSLPHLPDAELSSRAQFMIGAMSHAVCGQRPFSQLIGEPQPADFRCTMRRLMVFLSGGLKAPATPEVHQ
ncbi:MAG TPA: TetR/AcrR family transcriptional regulator [Bryobacteraceae bacterium]|nr:TetR/AcrR family transcriptional regulator [Bryobacteraceae bacterium]